MGDSKITGENVTKLFDYYLNKGSKQARKDGNIKKKPDKVTISLKKQPKPINIENKSDINISSEPSRVQQPAGNTSPQTIQVEPQKQPDINIKNDIEQPETKSDIRPSSSNDPYAYGRSMSTTEQDLKKAVLIAIIYDIVDGLLTALSPATGFIYEGVELILNIFLVKYIRPKFGTYYHGFFNFWEYIPGVDVLPFYTLTSIASYIKFKNDHETDPVKQQRIIEKRQRRDKIKQKLNISIGTQGARKGIIAIMLLIILAGGLFMTTTSGARFIGNIIPNIVKFFTEDGLQRMMNRFTGMMKGWVERIEMRFKEQVATAKGDVFVGQVENSKDLGLSVEVDKPIAPFTGDIFLTATLSGRSLDPDICNILEEQCDINSNIFLSCFTDRDEQGRITTPNTDFEEIRDTFLPLSCTFEKNNLNPDTSTRIGYFKADFEFLATGSLKKDFISRSKYTELKDMEDFNQDIPTYSKGPVSITFSETIVKINPLIVDKGRYTTFGFRIKNEDSDGIVKKIKKITVMIPEGVRIRQCHPALEGEGNKRYLTYDENEERNFLNELRNRNLKPGQFIDINCELDLQSSSILDANKDYTSDYFHVLALYDYKEHGTTSFTLDSYKTYTRVSGDEICPTDYCECETTERIIQKGETCSGKTQREIDAECLRLSNSECKNNCKWLDGACRAKTIES